MSKPNNLSKLIEYMEEILKSPSIDGVNMHLDLSRHDMEQLTLSCRKSGAVKYKCSNPFCPYGPHWDAGLPDPFPGEKPEEARADAYSQEPAYRKNGRKPWDGKCLNCIDDQNKAERESY